MHVDYSGNYTGGRYIIGHILFKRRIEISQVWWDLLTIPARWSMRREDHEFEATLVLHAEILSQSRTTTKINKPSLDFYLSSQLRLNKINALKLVLS